MTGICGWIVDRSLLLLEAGEREVVRGDIVESGETQLEALRDVLGLVVRRQAALWGLMIPLGMLLTLVSRLTADGSAVRIWMYANNWDWSFFSNKAFQHDFPATVLAIFLEYLMLGCWSWSSGFVLGAVSRRSIPIMGLLFGSLLLFGELLGAPYFLLSLSLHPARHYNPNGAVFELAFYRVVLPFLVQVGLVGVPALWGMRQGVRLQTSIAGIAALVGIGMQTWIWWQFLHGGHDWHMRLLSFVVYWPVAYWVVGAFGHAIGRRRIALFLALAGLAVAAEQPRVRADLQPTGDRKNAAEIHLKDSAGKSFSLKQYRGKVVLLDFWATWCHGCKEEIPWFVEFDRLYRAKGLVVVGVSLDDDGWKVVKPFVGTARIPYRIVLGDEVTSRAYGIQNMPDTFLIDRQGKIAATYSGVVDRANVEENIRTMLHSVAPAGTVY